MQQKICEMCGENKSINEFRKYRRKCKECEKEGYKIYYIKHKNIALDKSKRYRDKNKDYYIIYRQTHSSQHKEYNKKYYEENKHKLITNSIKYEKKRIKEDDLYKIKKQVRKVIYNSFYRLNHCKCSKTEKIIKIGIDDFIRYLLKTYKSNYGVEWDGVEKIHIDHIIPLATATTEEEIIKLCHYTNLQLLKAKDNLEKSCKLNWELTN